MFVKLGQYSFMCLEHVYDKGDCDVGQKLMRRSKLYYKLSLPLMLKALIFVRYVHPSFVKAMAAFNHS